MKKPQPTLSETNRLWLDKAAKKFGLPPEGLMNVILDRIRSKDQDKDQRLMDWIDSAGAAEAELGELAQDVKEAVTEAKAAINATRLYVSLIQANRL